MKKKIAYSLLALSGLVLFTSCSGDSDVDTVTKEVDFYYLEDNGSNHATKKNYSDSKVELTFIVGNDYLPYITFEDFISFYDKDYVNDGANKKYEADSDELEYSIEYNGKKVDVTIDDVDKVITIDGYFKDFSNSKPKNSTEIDATFSTEIVKGDFKKTYKYDKLDIETIVKNKKKYFPLSFLTSLFNNQDYFNIFYNYDSLYRIDEFSDLYELKFDSNGVEKNIIDEMKSKITSKEMPEYLKEFIKNNLYFHLCNDYGLKEYKRINSMYSYLNSLDFADDLLSNDSNLRLRAINGILGSLSDDSTKLLYQSKAWISDDYSLNPQSSNSYVRETIKNGLENFRTTTYESLGYELDDIVISSDNSTALIYLDSFEFTNEIYNLDELKTDSELAKLDSYYYLKNKLEELKMTNVENVIIDISTNNFGSKEVLSEILALLSNDNQSVIYNTNTLSLGVSKTTCRLDLNRDGKIDSNDHTYGDDFNFYILTSPVTYSAANAFAMYESLNGVTTIGQNSGGGECLLNIDILPTGDVFSYSSSDKFIGYNSDNKEVSFEEGTIADITVNYSSFYNIDLLTDKIKNYNK